jgi:hypothetical protein
MVKKDKKVIIQDEIKISQKEVDDVIKSYKKMPKRYYLGIGGWSGNRDNIIEEIKNLTEVGKQILLMNYKFRRSEFFTKFQKRRKDDKQTNIRKKKEKTKG